MTNYFFLINRAVIVPAISDVSVRRIYYDHHWQTKKIVPHIINVPFFIIQIFLFASIIVYDPLLGTENDLGNILGK